MGRKSAHALSALPLVVTLQVQEEMILQFPKVHVLEAQVVIKHAKFA